MNKSVKKGYTAGGDEKNSFGNHLKPGDINEGIHSGKGFNSCANFSCRLRKAGCGGFEGCPGYMSR
jgi:hypothetical protein